MRFKYYSVRNLLSYVFFGIFCVSVFFLGKNILAVREEKVSVSAKKDVFLQIRKRVKTVAEEIEAHQKHFNNKEIKGVLEIKTLDIYLPFVQGNNNDFYLRMGLDKKYDIEGALFLDYRNDLSSDRQLNLYGHSSPNTILPFNKLFGYRDKKFLEKNKEIILKKGNEIIKYEVIYSITTIDNDEHMKIHFDNIDARMRHYEALRSLSVHRDTVLSQDDDILVLQTCLQGDESGKKLAVIAKRV